MLSLLALVFLVADPPPGAEGRRDFDRVMAPLLARNCLGCHSGPEPKGKLDLTSRALALKGGASGVVVVPGQPEESLLWEHIDGDTMPPKSPLPEGEKALIRQWIADGAPWGTDPLDPLQYTTNRRAGRDWWSLQPVVRPTVPQVREQDRIRNPIDAFVLHTLDAKGLSPSPPADRRTLIRRLTFDLIGLPPTPEEVEAFLNDDRPDAYERLTDRLLASPQYGVRWARLWLDLARYGESNGFEHDEFRPDAWRYRDWVVKALNRDMPFDEFARLQIAGDVLHPDDPEAIEATGFLVAGAYDSVGQMQISDVMRKVVRQDDLEDVVGTVSQAFLGLTVHCARCHDHKFDPIRQTEYYRLAAALGGVRHGERDLTPLDPDVKAARKQLAALAERLEEIERPVRARSAAGSVPTAPTPFARWDFDRDVGSPDVALKGGAKLSSDGLRLDGGTAFAISTPLTKDISAKTLEAWVRLDNLDQSGGGVISIQSPDGFAFDAIVFGEREPRRWMAGSEGFARTRSFQGPDEDEATRKPVHLAIVYAEDGTITAYREGRPYGTSYKSSGPVTFRAGQAHLLFGMRHGTEPGGNHMLAGRIVRARLYDRALTAEEVAVSASLAPESINSEAIAAALSSDQRQERSGILDEIQRLRRTASERTRRAYAVAPRPPETSHLLIRGNPAQPGEVVSAGGVAALVGSDAEFGLSPDAPESERRIRLAAWITDSRNPLFARVIVNRLWQAHFGVGLVEMPSDFGFNGGRPSHPELLDWLASELVARGWSLKRIHRLIVTSATYRQSSRSNPAVMKVDGSNRLLWRKTPLRLEAEMVRDAMLSVSGSLDPKLGGPGFREFAITKAKGTISHLYPPIDASGPEHDRRTLYRTWARGGRNGLLDTFDCPDPSTTAPHRASTTTPLQALALLNNALTLRLSDRFADRLKREAGDDPRRQVERAYRLAFGRSPDAEESESARKVVERFGPAVLARALFNSNEFLYVD